MDIPLVFPDEANRLLGEGAFLLDVREDDEWVAGRSSVATHIPLAEVPTRMGELPEDRTVIAICRAGGRSEKAAEFLLAQGVYAVNMAGGMRAWAAAGYDVVTETGEPGTVI